MQSRRLRLPLALVTLALGACQPGTTHDSSDAGEPPHAELDAGPDASDDAGVDAGLYESGEGYVAGSRLEPSFHTAPGGARLFDGWFDHELATPCSFHAVTDADGSQHRVCANAWWPTQAFRDADCTEPVALTGPNDHFEGSLVLMTLGYICGDNDQRLYELGEAIELTKTYRNNNATGTCQEDEDHSGLVPHVLKPVALSTFVSGQRVEMLDEPGSPLTVAYSKHSDGSEQLLAPSLQGEECAPEASAGGDDYRCMPILRPVDDGTLFGDEGCSEPAARGYSAGCNYGTTKVGERVQRDAEGKLERSFHVLGEALPKAFVGQPDACSEEDVSWDLAYRVGEELPWSSFPALSVELAGEGRLRTVRATTPGGHQLPPAGFIDTELGVGCAWRPDVTDSDRCIPSGQAEGYYTYADADCSVPVGMARVGSDVRYLLFHNAFDQPFRLFEAAPYAGPLYERGDGEHCNESSRGRRVDFYVAGEQVALETLAPLH